MGLYLDNVKFELDTQTRDSAFFIFEGDEGEGLEFSIDCSFKDNKFQGENVSPSITIHSIETDETNMEDLQDIVFEVNTVEEADEREDTFYIFEHEPIENYKLEVLEIKNNKAHITCTGTAIVDGYSKPYTTKKFEIDCWLPVITDEKDWVQFGL